MNNRFHLEQAKQELLHSLQQRGVAKDVLNAISSVPRELFIPEPLRYRAYEDTALPIGHGQTISQPYTVAYMTQILEVRNDNRVLEIGTGSGYQTAILCSLGAHVWSIERIPDLAERARNLLDRLGYHPTIIVGNGWDGYMPAAPYDRIIVTAAAPEIPMTLARQLTIGGKMVVPVGKNEQSMYLVTRSVDNEFEVYASSQRFRFVPFVHYDESSGHE